MFTSHFAIGPTPHAYKLPSALAPVILSGAKNLSSLSPSLPSSPSPSRPLSAKPHHPAPSRKLPAVVLAAARLALLAIIATVVFPRGASAQTLTVIHPNDPSFESLLTAAYPGIENMAGFQDQRRFMVLLRNDSSVAANAYLVAWDIRTSDGMNHPVQMTFVRKNYLGRGDDTPLLPGQVCMASPFLYAPPAASGHSANFTHIMPAAYGQSFATDQVQSVTATLDEAIFEDGARIGPKHFQLSTKYDCLLAAELDEPASIRRLLESNASEGDIVLRFNKDIAPLRNPAIYRSSQREDICAQYRGEVAQNIMMRYRYGGLGALRAELTPTPNIVIPSNFQTVFLLPAQFSADIDSTITTGADVRHQGIVGHLEVGQGKMREDVSGSGAQSTILDLAQKRSWVLFTARNWAQDMTPSVKWDSLGLPPMRMEGWNTVERPYDPAQPCFQLVNISCEKMGTDTVDGRSCDVWVLTETVQARTTQTRKITLCLDPKLRFPLRAQSIGSIYELHNVKEAPQDASLFEIPEDYHKVFADGTESGPPAQAFDLKPFQQNSYVTSHQGQPIGSIGLSEAEVSSILAMAGVDASVILARHVDMGEGADNGLVLAGSDSSVCGATGNCATWFFHKVAGKWQFVVSGERPGEDSSMYTDIFGFVPPKHNGLFEMITMANISAGESPFAVWWFDGAKYTVHATYCSYGDRQITEGDCR